jgi:hypothetical protein
VDLESFVPSTCTGMTGDGGLFEADDWLLPEGLLLNMYSVTPLMSELLVAGAEAFGESFPFGVPN